MRVIALGMGLMAWFALGEGEVASVGFENLSCALNEKSGVDISGNFYWTVTNPYKDGGPVSWDWSYQLQGKGKQPFKNAPRLTGKTDDNIQFNLNVPSKSANGSYVIEVSLLIKKNQSLGKRQNSQIEIPCGF